MRRFIKINVLDNVAVALAPLKTGEILSAGTDKIKLMEDIKKGHKFTLKPLKKGDSVIKYGMPIGSVTRDVKAGMHIHTHNTKTSLGDLENYSYTPAFEKIRTDIPPKTISAYRRANGETGIRNELWIVPTVGCVNPTADLLISEFMKKTGAKGIDGIHVFKHSYGCSQTGEDHANTKKILQNIVLHPNAGGVLILGLGCENNQIADFVKELGTYDRRRIRTLVTQDVKDEIREGVKLLDGIYRVMKNDRRTPVPLSRLNIGLKCGGSDGFSGITANPLLGRVSDYLVASGGTSVLTEVPEMFGAETILMNRAADKKVFAKIVSLINNFKLYFKKHGQTIYENPSPGNKEGGITTLEDKSLGCTQKAGGSKVVDVLDYGERIMKKGLNLLCAPGNDLVASTTLGAAGCHMVLFTTGRGTPFGTFIPTVKISTNTDLFRKKPGWIDFDAGCLLKGKQIDLLTEEIINYIVDVANGKQTNNEKNNFREIAIFKQGITL